MNDLVSEDLRKLLDNHFSGVSIPDDWAGSALSGETR